MFERVKRRSMSHDCDRPAGKDDCGFRKPHGDPLRDEFQAFAGRVQRGDVLDAVRLDLNRWTTRQRAVIALPKAPIADERNAAASERDFRGPDRAKKIGGKHGGQIVVTTAVAEIARLLFSGRREDGIVPTRGDPSLVVDAGGMRLEDDHETR